MEWPGFALNQSGEQGYGSVGHLLKRGLDRGDDVGRGGRPYEAIEADDGQLFRHFDARDVAGLQDLVSQAVVPHEKGRRARRQGKRLSQGCLEIVFVVDRPYGSRLSTSLREDLAKSLKPV